MLAPEPLPLPKARLEALTDGIFAVTMTLLVLDLRFPEHPHESVYQELASLLPRIDNYVISFVVLAVFWLGHIRMLHRMREADHQFAGLNLAFLLCTTLVPPLTALVGSNPTMPRGAVLYGGNLILILVCEALAWKRVCFHLANETITDAPALWHLVRRRFALAIAIVVCAIGVALVEMRLGWTAGYAPWLYLLLIAVGIVRPVVRSGVRAKGRG